jgi:hypothetical protein
MEDVSVLVHHLVSFLTLSHPSCVLVIIVYDMVEILLEGINKGSPSWFYPEFHILIFVMFLAVKFPPIFGMGEGFKESEGDILDVINFLNGVIPI